MANELNELQSETRKVSPETSLIWFVFFWSLYGVFSTMSYTTKNTGYNILDIFSKNFFGLFLASQIRVQSIYR
jgi:hypothetical protein